MLVEWSLGMRLLVTIVMLFVNQNLATIHACGVQSGNDLGTTHACRMESGNETARNYSDVVCEPETGNYSCLWSGLEFGNETICNYSYVCLWTRTWELLMFAEWSLGMRLLVTCLRTRTRELACGVESENITTCY